MQDKMGFKGVYEIISRNIITGEETKQIFENVITQLFYDTVHAFLDQSVSAPSVDDLNVDYVAVGDDDTTATRVNTTLGNEILRKTYATRTFQDTAFKVSVSIGAAEGNPAGGFIKEIGIFAKSTATPDSGTMISRSVVDVRKNSNIQLLVTWYLRSA